MLLKIFLGMLLIPTSLTAIGMTFSAFSRNAEPSILLRAIALFAIWAFVATIAYSLFVDWDAAIWIVAATAFMPVALAIMMYTQMRQEGLTLSQGLAQLREGWDEVRVAKRRVHQVVQDSTEDVGSSASSGIVNQLFKFVLSARWLIGLQFIIYVTGYLVLPWTSRFLGLPHLIALDAQLLVLILIGALVARPSIFTIRFRPDWNSEIALVRVGLALYFVGVVLNGLPIIAVLFGVFLSSATVHYPLVCIGGILAHGGRTLLRTCTFKTASEAMEHDRRPPILYLRSFKRENRWLALKLTFREKFGYFRTLFSIAKALGKTIRENDEDMVLLRQTMNRTSQRRTLYGRLSARSWAMQIASGRGSHLDDQSLLADTFNQIGPYIAVKRPGETGAWADVGAYKLPMPPDRWKPLVQELIRKSRFVVVEAGETSSLIWELEQVISQVPPRKMLLVLPRTDFEYFQFLKGAAGAFPVPLPNTLPNSRFLMFDDWWNPVALENTKNVFDDPMPNEASVHVLTPFFHRNDIGGSSKIRIAPL